MPVTVASKRAGARLQRVVRDGADLVVRTALGRLDVPPWSLREAYGAGPLKDWWVVADEFAQHLRTLARLGSTDRVLEVGCGAGRLAVPLARDLRGSGGYDGFDILPGSIAWAQRHLTPRHPALRFHHADLHNSVYNPRGRLKAADFRFPFPDGTFDIVFAASLFTHLLPADTENYLRETARVLRPRGRVLFTFFLLDQASVAAAAQRFPHPFGGLARVERLDEPEAAIAYERRWLLDAFREAGLAVERVEPGQWRGQDGASFQDLVLAGPASPLR